MGGTVAAATIILAGAYWMMANRGSELPAAGGAPLAAAFRQAAEAADFTAESRKGGVFRLSSLRGKYVLLNFWATWCPPCVEEMPSLLRFASFARGWKNLVVVAASMDEEWEPVVRLMRSMPARDGADAVELVLDRSGRSASQYGTSKYPETFLIDPGFRVVRKFAGSQNWMEEGWLRWISEKAR